MVSAPKPAPRRTRAIQYAEDVLGVHLVYDSAVSLSEELSMLLESKSNANQSVRQFRVRLEQREYEIALEVQKDLANSSQAAIDREIKNRLFGDEAWTQCKKKLTMYQEILDGTEGEARAVELKLRVETARISELGGYLNYLASCKNATAVSMSISGSPWS